MRSCFRTRASTQIEILALRDQLDVLQPRVIINKTVVVDWTVSFIVLLPESSFWERHVQITAAAQTLF